jgi:hypothetical protein
MSNALVWGSANIAFVKAFQCSLLTKLYFFFLSISQTIKAAPAGSAAADTAPPPLSVDDSPGRVRSMAGNPDL